MLILNFKLSVSYSKNINSTKKSLYVKMKWSRPTSVPFPKTWLQFESNKEEGRHFVVRDLTKDYYDAALGYLTNMLLQESAISGPLNITADKEAREQMQQIWLTAMESKMALVCLTIDDKLPRVAGVHITMIKYRNTGMNKKSSANFTTFAEVVEELKDAGQIFDRFKADYYLGSLGLFVLPEFRGHGIATHIIMARENMCRTFNLKGCATVFSTAAAQAAAKSAGYQVFAERKVDDIEKRYGVKVNHDLKIMGKCFL